MNDYLNRLRPAFPHKTEAELELVLSASRQLQKETGLTAHEHRKRGMLKLFPSRVWHEWREQRIASVQECLEGRIQELMWMGSSNSNKTGDLADIALTLWWTKPEMTSIYVASPYERATEKGVWVEILEQFEEAKLHNPALPGRIKRSENSIVQYERNPRSFIEVVTTDNIGKLVGKKSKDASQGLLVFILDELPAFTPTASRALLAVMANLISVQNLIVIGAGNFANPWDAFGAFCDPSEADIPGGYDGFDPDTHFRWKTKRGGLCLRFDGLQSPNVKLGRDAYPFLTTIAYINKLASRPGGLKSAESMRFVRSAPVTALDEFTVTNGERIRAGGSYDPYEWTGDPVTSGAYVDPGFGGDDCVLQKFKLGYIKIPDGRRQVIALWEPPFYIPVQIGLLDAAGTAVPVERQIVAGVRRHCEERHIPPAHVGFDGSMRASIVQEFAKWSLQVHAIDSNGAATDRQVNAAEVHDAKPGEQPVAVKWKEKVDRLLSEFWFAASSLIDSFQLRGLELSPKAAKQLTTRRWSWSGARKRKVETKPEYKENLKAAGALVESPNEADAVVGCVEMARRLGLALAGLAPGGGSLDLVLSIIRDRAMAKNVDLAKRAAKVGLVGTGLPSGSLHAIKPTSPLPSGRLNRR
jgi:hypothetical protein